MILFCSFYLRAQAASRALPMQYPTIIIALDSPFAMSNLREEHGPHHSTVREPVPQAYVNNTLVLLSQ